MSSSQAPLLDWTLGPRRVRSLPGTGLLAVAGLLAAASLALSSQARATEQNKPPGPPPSPVRYTEAREHPVRRTIRLSGSVESRTASLVASEVAGVVAELLAREGDVVRLGQPLARLRTATLELRLRSSVAEHKEAAGRLKQAERNLTRIRDLRDSNIASQQQLDDAESEFDAWQGKVERLAAEIERIRHDLEYSTIAAPFAGTVVAKKTDVGEWIEVGSPVVEIVSLDELEVRVEVPERYFRSLSPGATAAVTFDALPGVEASGRVTAIIPRADPQARTFPVKVRIRNREGRIGVGMLAQVSLPAGESYRAVVIPKDAVVSEGPQKVVYLINGRQVVDRVPVETGAGVGSWVTVEGPIKPGQKVITRGNERLRPGMPVTGEPLEYALP